MGRLNILNNSLDVLIKRPDVSGSSSHVLIERWDVLNKCSDILCELLWCGPYDLLIWKPAADHKIPDDHPLFPLLHKNEQEKDFRKMISKVPYEKLNAISELLRKQIDG